MRVIICGSRRWDDRKKIIDRLAELPGTSTIVHGRAANGADKIAHQEAEKLGLRVEPHPANWARHGKSAGFVRNKEMVDLGADLVIAFWDGKSNGTKHTMDLAEAAGIPVEVVWFDPEEAERLEDSYRSGAYE
jgi:YspA, cpYpsA-related SLOG family